MAKVVLYYNSRHSSRGTVDRFEICSRQQYYRGNFINESKFVIVIVNGIYSRWNSNKRILKWN